MNFTFEELRTLIVQSPYQELIITVICFIGILIAIANCFCGYRLLRLWSTLFGIAVGAMLGNHISRIFTDSLLLRIGATVLTAVILGALSYRFRTVGTFIICGAMSFSLAYYFVHFFFDFGDNVVQLLIAVVIGISCGLLAHFFKRPAIMLITAICGSYTTLSTIISRLHLDYPPWVYWFLIFLIAFFGFCVQFTTYRINESKKISKQKKGGSH